MKFAHVFRTILQECMYENVTYGPSHHVVSNSRVRFFHIHDFFASLRRNMNSCKAASNRSAREILLEYRLRPLIGLRLNEYDKINTEATLCTISIVYEGLVHHRGAMYILFVTRRKPNSHTES